MHVYTCVRDRDGIDILPELLRAESFFFCVAVCYPARGVGSGGEREEWGEWKCAQDRFVLIVFFLQHDFTSCVVSISQWFYTVRKSSRFLASRTMPIFSSAREVDSVSRVTYSNTSVELRRLAYVNLNQTVS